MEACHLHAALRMCTQSLGCWAKSQSSWWSRSSTKRHCSMQHSQCRSAPQRVRPLYIYILTPSFKIYNLKNLKPIMCCLANFGYRPCKINNDNNRKPVWLHLLLGRLNLCGPLLETHVLYSIQHLKNTSLYLQFKIKSEQTQFNLVKHMFLVKLYLRHHCMLYFKNYFYFHFDVTLTVLFI